MRSVDSCTDFGKSKESFVFSKTNPPAESTLSAWFQLWLHIWQCQKVKNCPQIKRWSQKQTANQADSKWNLLIWSWKAKSIWQVSKCYLSIYLPVYLSIYFIVYLWILIGSQLLPIYIDLFLCLSSYLYINMYVDCSI